MPSQSTASVPPWWISTVSMAHAKGALSPPSPAQIVMERPNYIQYFSLDAAVPMHDCIFQWKGLLHVGSLHCGCIGTRKLIGLGPKKGRPQSIRRMIAVILCHLVLGASGILDRNGSPLVNLGKAVGFTVPSQLPGSDSYRTWQHGLAAGDVVHQNLWSFKHA